MVQIKHSVVLTLDLMRIIQHIYKEKSSVYRLSVLSLYSVYRACLVCIDVCPINIKSTLVKVFPWLRHLKGRELPQLQYFSIEAICKSSCKSPTDATSRDIHMMYESTLCFHLTKYVSVRAGSMTWWLAAHPPPKLAASWGLLSKHSLENGVLHLFPQGCGNPCPSCTLNGPLRNSSCSQSDNIWYLGSYILFSHSLQSLCLLGLQPLCKFQKRSKDFIEQRL